MLHFLLEIIVMTRSTKTRLLLRNKCKVVHSDHLYRPHYMLDSLCDIVRTTKMKDIIIACLKLSYKASFN